MEVTETITSLSFDTRYLSDTVTTCGEVVQGKEDKIISDEVAYRYWGDGLRHRYNVGPL